jgi:hypothetical protein
MVNEIIEEMISFVITKMITILNTAICVGEKNFCGGMTLSHSIII